MDVMPTAAAAVVDLDIPTFIWKTDVPLYLFDGKQLFSYNSGTALQK